MKIILNGSAYKIFQGKKKQFFSVANLIEKLGVNPSSVAVEMNGEIIKRADFGSTPISDGDKIEIIRFMGGG